MISALLLRGPWVLRFRMISLTSLEETVLRTRRAILEAPLKRRIRIIVIILMVVVLLSLVLLELVLEVDLLNSGCYEVLKLGTLLPVF
jgi:hypothetical protein